MEKPENVAEYPNAIINVPCVVLRNITILPDILIHFDLSKKESHKAVSSALKTGQEVFLVTQKSPDVEEAEEDDVYRVGTLSKIRQIIKMPQGIIRVMVEAGHRAELIHFTRKEPWPEAEVHVFTKEEEINTSQDEAEAMKRDIMELFVGFLSFFPKVGRAFGRQFEDVEDLGRFLDLVIANIPVDYDKKQEALEAVDYRSRYEKVREILDEETRIANIRMELAEKIQFRVDKDQRDYILREQLHFIREELGEDNSENEADKYQKQCDELNAPDSVKERIYKEIDRFRNTASGSSESGVEQSYIETLLSMPWNNASKENKSLDNAKKVLERDHYGLDKVKERMLEFLAVKNLTEKGQSPIICLIGPPGTGKTSIAKSIAESLNLKYIRVSLGGVRDEAEIRGHRKTYVGAMPGVIASGLLHSGVRNPLILLDEIDKVSSEYRGATASALLEVLDSEQNKSFRDHYIEIPLDLSDVLFIATANSTDGIPRPLLDRMEIVEVSGYTENEKLHIAREHLLQKQLKKNGLKKSNLSISEDAMKNIISLYTRESGVRSLERRIGEICRKTAKAIYTGETKKVRVTPKNLKDYLGTEKYLPEEEAGESAIGIVRGLAWTAYGGVTLEVEVNIMPGKGGLILTGQLGDVMQESAKASMTFVRSISEDYGIGESFFRTHDFHVHIPEGATPKDGPSAGVTMATALFSAVTKVKVRSDVAMTGEITLRGRVLPIGGLKEKILAAKAAKIMTVLVPDKNHRDIDDLSDEIKEGVTIYYMKEMSDVLEKALVVLPEKKPVKKNKRRGKVKENGDKDS
ncbi:MAG: endopeptidase La [Lachnospiraceae bacterium]|nr:endopeptidase La [Lachnospiraceae bacterium]